MYVSRMFGLTVHSDLFLTFTEQQTLPPSAQWSDAADVVIKIAAIDNFQKQDLDCSSCFMGSLTGVGQVLICNGNQIILEPDPGVSEALIRSTILGSGMAILLQQRGYLVLHGSCVAIEDQAIAFIGASGAGKSTTASALHSKGYPFITDDILAIDFREGHPFVFSSVPILKLLPDAAVALGYNFEDLSLLHRESPKRVQSVSTLNLKESFSLRKVYLLGIGHHHRIHSLSASEALLALIFHSREPKTLTTAALQACHFKQCSHLVQSVVISRLERPRALNELSKIVHQIEVDLLNDIR